MSELKFPNISSIVQSGRLTRDAEVKIIGQNATPIAKVSIAFSKSYQKDGEWVEKTGYVDIKAFNKLADRCKELHKGDPIIVEGSLDYESWQTKNQENRSKLVITAKAIRVLSKSEERMDNSVENPVVTEDPPF